MTIKIYTAKHCLPCKDLMERLKQALSDSEFSIDGDDIKIIDIETDEGFEEFSREVLSKGDSSVPSAYKNGQRCQILVEDDDVLLDCPSPDDSPEYHPSSEKG